MRVRGLSDNSLFYGFMSPVLYQLDTVLSEMKQKDWYIAIKQSSVLSIL